jgi:proteasome lid subunit RPN8/RPN11
MTMFPEFLEQIRAEALAAYPEEAVWLVTPGECRLVKNTHQDPANYFSVAPRTLASAMKRGLLAVVHSHPDGFAAPSEADMRSQIDSAVPWGLLATDGVATSELVWWGAGAPLAPVIGRHFRHGVTDCYALIKDYYSVELGISLPEFPRSWEWWNEGGDGFLAGFPAAGFVRIDASEAKPGDVWLAQIRSVVPNHGGVLLAGDMILHQLGATKPVDHSRLSVREPLHRYTSLITHWLRHAGATEK